MIKEAEHQEQVKLEQKKPDIKPKVEIKEQKVSPVEKITPKVVESPKETPKQEQIL